MYCLSDEQIAFILRDIRDRGVEMESLQQDLLDHVCCIIEQNLEAGGNFEEFYATTIRTFYQKELKEIEEETIFLLTLKNYYAMKKIMLTSGAFSAIILSAGILFKFMHWPGAGMLIVSGIVLFSLLFLPLLFTLRLRERQQTQDKFILATGGLSGILFCLSTMFKLQHWPLANMLGLSAIGLMLLVFLPVYFFTGIRNAETKVNSIVTAILIVAGAGLLMSLVRSPGNSTFVNKLDTANFLRSEQILNNEQKLTESHLRSGSVTTDPAASALQVAQLCQDLKTYLVEKETGYKTIPADYESKQVLLTNGWARDYFEDGSEGAAKLNTLRQAVNHYNEANAARSGFQPIPVKATVLDKSEERTVGMLQGLIQIQLLVLQNEQQLLAGKQTN